MKKTIVPLILAVSIMLIMPIIVYATTLTWYALASTNLTVGMFAGNVIMAGENVNDGSLLEGKPINGITLRLSKSGSPTGNYYVGVWGNGTSPPTNANYKYLISTNNSALLTTTATDYTFYNNASSYTMVQGDVIGVYYNGGSSPNRLNVAFNTYANPTISYDGFNSYTQTYIVAWNTGSNVNHDLRASVFFSDDTPTPPPNPNGVDCNLPENANILICRLGGDGTLGSAGAFVIGNTTQGTGLLGIGCGIGLVDCTVDDNPKTNGLGLLVFIASIFVVVGMFVTTQGLQNTVKLPVYMWAMIIIALSAFFTLTNIIDPVFLIISIIGLIALGAPKLVNTFKGGSTFGSGSTE